ncbi:MAG: hypothetical protein AB7M93_30505 [Candidatus Obscuribacterales bacterium]
MKVEIDPVILSLVSASIGAFVSSLFAMSGQYFERRYRRKEMIFRAAIDQAKRRVGVIMEIAKVSQQSCQIPDETMLVETYYKWLAGLFDRGKLPKDAIEAEEASRKELEAVERLRSERQRLRNDRVVNEAGKHPLAARRLLSETDLTFFTEEQFEYLQQSAGQPYP